MFVQLNIFLIKLTELKGTNWWGEFYFYSSMQWKFTSTHQMAPSVILTNSQSEHLNTPINHLPISPCTQISWLTLSYSPHPIYFISPVSHIVPFSTLPLFSVLSLKALDLLYFLWNILSTRILTSDSLLTLFYWDSTILLIHLCEYSSDGSILFPFICITNINWSSLSWLFCFVAFSSNFLETVGMHDRTDLPFLRWTLYFLSPAAWWVDWTCNFTPILFFAAQIPTVDVIPPSFPCHVPNVIAVYVTL